MPLPRQVRFKCPTCHVQSDGWKLTDGRLVCSKCSPPILVNDCIDQLEVESKKQALRVWTAQQATGMGSALKRGAALAAEWGWAGLKLLHAVSIGILKVLCHIPLVIMAVLEALSSDSKASDYDDDWDDDDYDEADEDTRLPSLRQLAFLVTLNAPIHSGMTRDEASEVIDEHNINPGDTAGKERYHKLLKEFQQRAARGESVEEIMDAYCKN